jgi:hypothetical protein
MEENKRREGQSAPAKHSRETQTDRKKQNIPEGFEGMNFEIQRKGLQRQDIRRSNRNDDRENNR